MHYSYEHMHKKSIQKADFDVEEIKTLIQDGFQKQDIIEYSTLLEDLKKLDEWCQQNDKKEFFQYFQDASIGAYYRFAQTKDKVWSNEKNLALIKQLSSLSYASPIIMPVVAAITTALEQGTIVLPENTPYLFIAGVIGTVMLVLTSVVRIAVCKHKENESKRNYYETWARHSLCNSRLRLAMSEFLVSEQTDSDYQKFVSSTFAVLEQNLDQFAVNMCPKGMASREKTNIKRGNP